MARTRTSIELHPDGCRLVEVEVFGSGSRARAAQDARVRAFVPSVPGAKDAALAAVLGRLRQERKLSRDAWVTVWGLRAVHQLLRLPPAKPEALESIARREARKELAVLEAGGGAASVAVVPGSDVQVGAHRRREVSLVAVSAAEIQERIQPLIDAGFVVRGVVTPALALAAISRLDRAGRGTVAYVATVGLATCLAIVRNGVLLFAREMPWGHQSGNRDQGSGVRDQGFAEHGSGTESRIPNPESLETRLASELKRSIMFFKQTFRAPVEAVVLCGDVPNLRALTGPLGEALEVPVETLDSLVGIDAASIPQPAELFRAEVAALRMAIATGADAAPAANLLPKTILESREARQQIVRFAGAAVVGLVLAAGWAVGARQTLASQHAERDAIQRELAIVEPDAVRQASLRESYTLAASRQAALGAFDSQGPRLARLLETLAASTPDAIVFTVVDVQADGTSWRVSLRGMAVSSDAADAQGAVNTLVDRLSASPFAGAPVMSPSRRVLTPRGTGVTGAPSATGLGRPAPIPPGMTGVEFSMLLRVAK